MSQIMKLKGAANEVPNKQINESHVFSGSGIVFIREFEADSIINGLGIGQ